MGNDRLNIPIALARHLVDSQFPQWAHLEVTPVEWNGWDNTTFRLGNDKKLRLPTAASYAKAVEKEFRFLPRLAGGLPFAVPEPLALGVADETYPFDWAVYKWLEGDSISRERIDDPIKLACDIADFLKHLWRADTRQAPAAGAHNFYRGGALSAYDTETRTTVSALGDKVDGFAALKLWDMALEQVYSAPPVWVHGDLAVGNLLLRDGSLHAVIDFGSSAIGDPACDLVIAWTFFEDDARRAFKQAVNVPTDMWKRARGWALWKALLVLRSEQAVHPAERAAGQVIVDLIAENHG